VGRSPSRRKRTPISKVCIIFNVAVLINLPINDYWMALY
jgi:hypothetical protein